MVTVLFNRDTLAWSGTDREPLLSEIPVHGIDVEKFSKGDFGFNTVIKYDEGGRPLYLLVKPGPSEERDIIKQEHVTEATDTPLLALETYQDVLKDLSGKPVSYKRKVEIKSTTVSDRPYMVKVLTHDGIKWEQDVNSKGELLYYNEKEVGKEIPCYTMKTREVQEKDENGNPLYVKFTTEKQIVHLDPVIEEITKYDPRWTEELYYATEQEEVLNTIKFKNNPEVFTFMDAINYKMNEHLAESFSSRALPLMNPLYGFNSILSPLDGDQLLNEFSTITYLAPLNVSASNPTKYITFVTDTSIPARMKISISLSNGTEIVANGKHMVTLTNKDIEYLNEVDRQVQVKVVNYDNKPFRLSIPALLY